MMSHMIEAGSRTVDLPPQGRSKPEADLAELETEFEQAR